MKRLITRMAAFFTIAAIIGFVGARMLAQGRSSPLNDVYLPVLLDQGLELRAIHPNGELLYLQKGNLLYSCASHGRARCTRIGAP